MPVPTLMPMPMSGFTKPFFLFMITLLQGVNIRLDSVKSIFAVSTF